MDRKVYRGFLIRSFHQQGVNDLNAAQIATHDGLEPLQDFSTISDDGKVRAFFKNLESIIHREILHFRDHIINSLSFVSFKKERMNTDFHVLLLMLYGLVLSTSLKRHQPLLKIVLL